MQWHLFSNYDKIILILNKVDSLEPHNPKVLTTRGVAKFDTKKDIDGALADFHAAIMYTKDKDKLIMRFTNLGLHLLNIGDIYGAKKAWLNAGTKGANYIAEYVPMPPDTSFRNNPDTNLILTLTLTNKTIYITSPHNSMNMSDCMANIELKNTNASPVTILNSILHYDIARSKSALYLEAMNSKGDKFNFYHQSTSSTTSPASNTLLQKGESFIYSLNIGSLHQFPYPGVYTIRLAIRPSENTIGLSKTYYSNWQYLKVKRQ